MNKGTLLIKVLFRNLEFFLLGSRIMLFRAPGLGFRVRDSLVFIAFVALLGCVGFLGLAAMFFTVWQPVHSHRRWRQSPSSNLSAPNRPHRSA